MSYSLIARVPATLLRARERRARHDADVSVAAQPAPSVPATAPEPVLLAAVDEPNADQLTLF